MGNGMKKALRLAGTGLLVLIAIRIADWLLTPVLPFLVSVFTLGLVFYVVLHGFRRDL